ncbi:MAG: response regulator transcription factor [Hydrogenophilales bacterium]|nr:response regulator transcription factor [Hydrogenophilales bacterium]
MINVFIADDHAIVRQGLKQIVSDADDMAVIGEAGNGGEALRQLRQCMPDVVILDIAMPDKSGIDVLKIIHKEKPKLPVLILSMYPEDQYAVRLIRAGASGYLTKESAPEQLVMAIRTLAQGRKYLTPQVAELLAQEVSAGGLAPHEALSDREHKVFLSLASGKTVTQIASELALSVKTVSTYRTRILEKMGLHSNAELTHYAFKNKLVE